MTASPTATLMLVDDEPNILSSLKRLLRHDGYTILTYEDPRQALAALAERPVDVILSDQRMPAMSGVEFLRQVRASHPETVRIVLSGYMDLQFISDAINEGAIYKFLTKPWDDEQLRDQVREACRSKSMADENRQLLVALGAANAQLEARAGELERQAGQLETTLDTLREVLQLIPWPILGVDEDDMVALANSAAEQLFAGHGLPLLGQSLRDISPGGDLAWLATPAPVPLGGRRYRPVRRAMGGKSQSRGCLIALMPLEAES